MSEHTQGVLGVAMIDGGTEDDELVTEVNGCLVNIAQVFGAGEYSEAVLDGQPEPSYTVSAEEAKANGRRLAACWNYCAGLDTAGMETAVEIGRTASVALYDAVEERLALIDQRDELLAALKMCLAQLEIVLPACGLVHDERQALIAAKAAIAKCEAQS